MVDARFTANGLVLNGLTLKTPPIVDEVLSVLGKPTLREDILLDQGKPWRKFILLDDSGIRLLYDFEMERIAEISFFFELSKEPYAPRTAFSGLLFLNGVRLIPGARETTLPVSGEFQFSKRGSWKASNDAFFVQMDLRKKHLTRAGITFLREPLAREETSA
jgi:hypothetical protein